MIKTIGKNGEINMGMANTTKKKRIFYPNMYYVVDKDNTILLSSANLKQLEQYEYDDTDTILYAQHPNVVFKREDKADKIVLDFSKNLLTITGNSVTLNKVEYEGNTTYDLEEAELKDWEDLLKDCRKRAKEFQMIGTPPIKGEILNVE